MNIGQTIDPRLSEDLMKLLDMNEIPHEEGALLWEFEKRGLWMYMSGPDEDKTVHSRWEVHVSNDTDISEIGHGQTARIALAKAFQKIVSQVDRG